MSEAYRLLRTDILFTRHDHPFQSLLGVGVKPGQGTTTTISNLAITLAQSGKKVILVDGDLRRPRLHEAFKRSNERGLTSVLNAQCVLEDALQPTEIANLMLLSAGPPSTQPSELLGSEEMRDLHQTLREAADFVLFDSPSAITFADAAILASFIDATLIVIRANEVPRKAEQDVRALLDRARANIIGVVLNGMTPERVDSAHYHGHYYPESKGKKNVPQLPSGGNDGPRSLPGGGDVWDDDEEFPAPTSSTETARPSEKPSDQEPPTSTVEEEPWDDEPAPAEKPNPARRWKSALSRRKSPLVVEEVEEEDELPAFDPTYVTTLAPEPTTEPPSVFDREPERIETVAPAQQAVPRWAAESTVPVFEISPEEAFDTEAALAFSTATPSEAEIYEPEATEQEKTFTPAVDMSWIEEIEELRQKLVGDTDFMPTGAEPPRKKSFLGSLFSRRA